MMVLLIKNIKKGTSKNSIFLKHTSYFNFKNTQSG